VICVTSLAFKTIIIDHPNSQALDITVSAIMIAANIAIVGTVVQVMRRPAARVGVSDGGEVNGGTEGVNASADQNDNVGMKTYQRQRSSLAEAKSKTGSAHKVVPDLEIELAPVNGGDKRDESGESDKEKASDKDSEHNPDSTQDREPDSGFADGQPSWNTGQAQQQAQENDQRQQPTETTDHGQDLEAAHASAANTHVHGGQPGSGGSGGGTNLQSLSSQASLADTESASLDHMRQQRSSRKLLPP
jgi:hypothetical protein